MNKKERKKLIAKISKASGVAQYAIEAKMSDDDIIELSQHLQTLQLLKSSNDYNRYCQAQKTAEANAKLKEFINPDNSEIIKAGKWLFSALAKKDDARKEHLLEKDLVHKEDYNESITDLTGVIEEQQNGLKEQVEMAKERIKLLEVKNDNLRKQLNQIKNYIITNLGTKVWDEIRKYIAS